jgi:uncharacterized protein DUF1569
MEQPSLYDAPTFTTIAGRIEALSEDSPAGWGQMNPAQMCAHCAEVQEVSNGKPLVGTPWVVKLMGPFIRRMVLGPKPFARAIRTHPQYEIEHGQDFAEQRDRLLAALKRMNDEGPEKASESVHPLFGRMTADEKGWAMYKHIDHHLAQFGV